MMHVESEHWKTVRATPHRHVKCARLGLGAVTGTRVRGVLLGSKITQLAHHFAVIMLALTRSVMGLANIA